MSLLLRSNPLGDLRPYRGTDRPPPCHRSDQPDDSAANQLFFRFLEISDTNGAVHDCTLLPELKYMAEAYNKLELNEHYEIVEVVGEAGEPFVGGIQLGIDISIGVGFSLLSSWRTAELERILDQHNTCPRSLAKLIYSQFKPLLNDNGLFNDCNVARECLDSVNCLQHLAPGTYEIGDYQLVRLYAIS